MLHNSTANCFHHRGLHSPRDEDVVFAQEDEVRWRTGGEPADRTHVTISPPLEI
jgi:hypothetical protein